MPGEYLRRVIADGACQRIGADGVGVLAFLAIQPQPVAMSREELGRRSGVSKKKAIEVVRAAIAAGWLSEVAGAGRAAGALTCVGLGPVVTETTRVVSVGASSGDVVPFPAPLAPPPSEDPDVVEKAPAIASEPTAAAEPFALACVEPKRPKRRPTVPKAVAIPPELDGEAFREAWERWRKYRAERRASLTPSTEGVQLRKLAAAGLSAALWAIEESIGQGWQGLFPEKYGQANTNTKGPGYGSARVGSGQRFKG